jgi:hypothetical protein
MISEKLNTIVKKHVSDSTTFWAGRPKMNEKELTAVNEFAKKKGEEVEKVFVGFDLDSAIKNANNKK